MSDNKSYMQTEYELKEEIKSINDKGFNTVLIRDKDQRDKRRFTKIFDIKLNELIYHTDLQKKYIDFFILLVNLNTKYIEYDLNMINLPIKEIAKNMQFSKVHIYNNLKVLKEHNLIDYYKKGNSNMVVINPCYYARFLDIRYMYFLENAFLNDKLNVSNVIDRIIVIKSSKNDRKNKYIDNQIKDYIRANCLPDWANSFSLCKNWAYYFYLLYQ